MEHQIKSENKNLNPVSTHLFQGLNDAFIPLYSLYDLLSRGDEKMDAMSSVLLACIEKADDRLRVTIAGIVAQLGEEWPGSAKPSGLEDGKEAGHVC